MAVPLFPSSASAYIYKVNVREKKKERKIDKEREREIVRERDGVWVRKRSSKEREKQGLVIRIKIQTCRHRKKERNNLTLVYFFL